MGRPVVHDVLMGRPDAQINADNNPSETNSDVQNVVIIGHLNHDADNEDDHHRHPPTPLTPRNSSSSSSHASTSSREHQANPAMNQTNHHHQQPRPLHVVQLPPSQPWSYHNYNAPAPPPPSPHNVQHHHHRPPPSTYYPLPHHHHHASASEIYYSAPRHHPQASAPDFFYSTPQLHFPPAPSPYHHSGQLPYYNPAISTSRHHLLPQHCNNYFSETGIPVQNNFQYLSMQLAQTGGGQGAWKTGLFECFDDPPNTLVTLFCPCWTLGQVAEIVDNGQTSCATITVIYVLISMCIFLPCLLSCTFRKKLRNKFDLPESPAPDCIIHLLCEWCALCQEHRELELRGLDPSIGWVGNMENMQRLQQKRRAEMVPPSTQRMMGYS